MVGSAILRMQGAEDCATLPGMSRNDFCTFGIGNGILKSLFPTSEIGNGHKLDGVGPVDNRPSTD